jgi:uncharacterized membrane protein
MKNLLGNRASILTKIGPPAPIFVFLFFVGFFFSLLMPSAPP